MNILINGIKGYMGREVYKLCESGYLGAKFAAGVDLAVTESTELKYYSKIEEVDAEFLDCIIDFSHHTSTHSLLSFAVKNNLPVVLATTAHTREEEVLIKQASSCIPVFYSANMSLAVALLAKFIKKTVKIFPDAEIEIIEKHHSRKIDSPSGTALMIADAIRSVRKSSYTTCGRVGQKRREKEEIGVHSVRCGSNVGEHEVIIATENQTITFRHQAHSRALFAEGAIVAAEFILKKEIGLYDMKNLIKEREF